MFVWPPMPLQPLDDGADRKFAHSERLALPMITAPAARSCWTMNASLGLLPASAHEPAVVGIPVVLMLSLSEHRDARAAGGATPRLRALSAVTRVGQRGRADGDHRVEHRVELLDPMQVELGELERLEPVAVHQLLELRDRRGVDVDAGDDGVARCAVGRWPGPAPPGANPPIIEHQE